MRKLCVLLALVLAACGPEARAPIGGSDAGTTDGGADGGVEVLPPVTTANPAGRQNVGPLAVTLTSDRAATIRYTTDGSDPTTSETATAGESPVVVTLVPPAKVTLRFFAKDAAGVAETPKSESYELIETTTPASITGTIFPHQLLRTASGHVGVALFTSDPSKGAGTEPVGFSTFAANLPNGANFKFESLPAGRYWAAAYYWSGDVNEKPEVYALARQNPIDVDPAVPAKQRVDFVNLYLGQCDPQDTGVDGEIVLAPHLQSHLAVVLAYRDTLTAQHMGEPSSFSIAPGTGERRPFALCNLAPGTVNLVGAVSQRDSNDPTDLVAAQQNPISVSLLTHTTLYLGATSPGLGSISGALHLSGPLPGGQVSVIVSKEPWSETAQIAGIATVLTTSAKNYNYAVTGLPPGKYYVAAYTVASDKAELLTRKESPVTINAATNSVIADFDIGVGRVTGTISVNDARANASSDPLTGEVAVLVSLLTASEPSGFTAATLGPPDSNGIRQATYSIFGLPDGNFRAAALIRMTSDTSWDMAFQRQHYAPEPGTTPPVFTIAGGNTGTANFDRLFQ